MEIYHKIQNINGIDTLTICVNYPDEYEFGLDFNSIKKKVTEVSDKIREYAFKYIGSVSDNTVLLILNGVVVGTLLVSQIAIPNVTNQLNPSTEIAQDINTNTESNVKDTTKDTSDYLKTEIEVPTQEITNEEENNTNVTTEKTNVKQPEISTKPNPNQTTVKPPTNTVKPPAQPSTPNPPTNVLPPVNTGKIINLKLASGKIIQIGLEDYVVGVVGSEMPAEFDSEALKAQAVAARTYALKRISNGATLTATTADQVYKTNDELKKMWGNGFNTYYNKVKNAVNATAGVCALYNGQYIDALYFSTSNGKTEDAKNVWGYSYPYLKSIDSSFDVGVRGFEQTKTISMATISQKLNVNLTSSSQIVINSKTVSGRVASISICGKTYTGVQIRTSLGLRSADFTCTASGNSIVFTTKGYGHGVGMSQYGANGMAKKGYNYTQILKHYYSGITVVKK